jgi:hypothetical protein
MYEHSRYVIWGPHGAADVSYNCKSREMAAILAAAACAA